MTEVSPDQGSYRDFRGRIYHSRNRIFRTVMPEGAEDFEFVRSSGLVEELTGAGRLVDERLVEREVLGEAGASAAYVLEHPRLPFVSWPYEWSFSGLKAAALLHLDIHLAALERGITMTDASAYNVQFIGMRPVFIDRLSFCKYTDGEYWIGHRQFCEQFINPLLLRSCLGVPHNAWYRGALEGISTEALNDMLRWRHKLSWHVLTNVALQARLQRSSTARGEAVRRARHKKLPLTALRQMLSGLRRWIAGLAPREAGNTTWESYPEENSYDRRETAAKRQFITAFVGATRPGILWDIGCNTGDYASAALAAGADYVVGFDSDHGALERAAARSAREELAFLPLYLDMANPSPDQGWGQSERGGLLQRVPADAVLALAVVHHLVIGKGIPLRSVLDSLLEMAPQGVVEFVPLSDPMVQQMLQLRDRHFGDYNPRAFENLLGCRARIVRSTAVSATGRTLYWYSRS
jgi:ribosomal protein L11 methylase PrmA